jgi:nitrous oxidase accessory protein NosD
MYIWTSNNIVTESAITDTIVGVLLSGSDNAITRNYISRNKQGVFFGWNEPGNIPLTIEISHNWFDDNTQHLSGCLCEDYNLTEIPHTWDDGKEGNHWTDYNGTDENGDGIGDTPYVVDVLNRDRYPLMQSPVSLPTVASKIPVEIILVAVMAALVVGALVVLKRRKMKP